MNDSVNFLLKLNSKQFLIDNIFLRNFFQSVLTPSLVNVAVGVTIANSVTDVVKSIKISLVTPMLTFFSKNPVPFEFSPLISSIFMMICVLLFVYIIILVPINKLRNKLTTTTTTEEKKL